MQSNPAHLVVGIGSRWHGDDAAGLLVAEQLAATCPANVEIRQVDWPGLQLLELWHSDLSVVLVDAMTTGAAPGTILCVDLLQQSPPRAAAVSSHALELAVVIAVARALGRLPRRLVFYGIEAGCLTPGSAPSEAVTAAVAQCVQLLIGAPICTA